MYKMYTPIKKIYIYIYVYMNIHIHVYEYNNKIAAKKYFNIFYKKYWQNK